MKLTQLRLSNFQCFGVGPTAIGLTALCFLLGPNGTGKTAVLQALARMFGLDSALRRTRKSDFHCKAEDSGKAVAGPLTLWIEADFEFPELKKANEAIRSNCRAFRGGHGVRRDREEDASDARTEALRVRNAGDKAAMRPAPLARVQGGRRSAWRGQRAQWPSTSPTA